jgi:hypothetical protein
VRGVPYEVVRPGEAREAILKSESEVTPRKKRIPAAARKAGKSACCISSAFLARDCGISRLSDRALGDWLTVPEHSVVTLDVLPEHIAYVGALDPILYLSGLRTYQSIQSGLESYFV